MGRTSFLQGLRRWYLLVALPLVLVIVNAYAEDIDIAGHITHRYADDYSQALFRWNHADQQSRSDQKAIFIIGNSAAREGISPSILEKHIGLPTHSFALTSARISDFSSDLIPATEGDILLVVLNESALDDRTPANPTLSTYQDSNQVPYLVKHRQHIARTAQARLFYASELLIGTKPDPIKAGSATKLFRFEGLQRLSAARLETIEKKMFQRLRAEGRDHAAKELEKLAKLPALYEGVEIVLLALPDDLPPLIRERYNQGVARGLTHAKAQGLSIIDARSLNLSQKDYYDFGHLLESGRRKLSHYVAVELEKIILTKAKQP